MGKTTGSDRRGASARTARDVLEALLERVGSMHGWCDQHGRRDTGRICVSHETVDGIEEDIACAVATLTYGLGDGGGDD